MSARRRLAPLAALAVLALAALPAGAASFHFDSQDGRLKMEDDVAVITAEDGSRARISPAGELTIRGRRVAAGARERELLRRYNATLHRVEDRAVEIGVESVGLAFSAIGHAVAAIATGDERRAERHVESRAEEVKQAARELCGELAALAVVQDVLAARIPSFAPYALIEQEDVEDCFDED